MAATFDGSDGERGEMEAPLLDIDPELNIFALANGLDLLRNQSRLPDRTLEWYRDGMERRIRLTAEAADRFRVTVEASRRKNGEPLLATAELRAAVTAAELSDELRSLLAEGVEAANALTRDDLSPAP